MPRHESYNAVTQKFAHSASGSVRTKIRDDANRLRAVANLGTMTEKESSAPGPADF
jgi:hypothetical protein